MRGSLSGDMYRSVQSDSTTKIWRMRPGYKAAVAKKKERPAKHCVIRFFVVVDNHCDVEVAGTTDPGTAQAVDSRQCTRLLICA